MDGAARLVGACAWIGDWKNRLFIGVGEIQSKSSAERQTVRLQALAHRMLLSKAFL